MHAFAAIFEASGNISIVIVLEKLLPQFSVFNLRARFVLYLRCEAQTNGSSTILNSKKHSAAFIIMHSIIVIFVLRTSLSIIYRIPKMLCAIEILSFRLE